MHRTGGALSGTLSQSADPAPEEETRQGRISPPMPVGTLFGLLLRGFLWAILRAILRAGQLLFGPRRGFLAVLLTVLLASGPLQATLQTSQPQDKAGVLSLPDSPAIPVPMPRPDIIQAFEAIEVLIGTPMARPDWRDVLPRSEQVGRFVELETGITTERQTRLTLKKNETLSNLLKRAGLADQDRVQAIEEIGKRMNLRRLQIGMGMAIAYDADNRPAGLQFSLPENIDLFVLRNASEGWYGLRAVRPTRTYLVHAAGVIEDSLYKAAVEVGLPLQALDEFVRVMGFSVDFQREVQGGDIFEIIYERTIDELDGREISNGKLHYAGILLSGEPQGFYRFEAAGQPTGWYDAEGQSAVRTLMRTPVSGARLSSSYGMRRHPITGYNALHRGVDFAVPTGTPILAAGSGRVEMAGWNGGYGRYIRIRHNSTYRTAYAHLSRYARGIRAGALVEQGQVIGFVGSSGRSTGPHLHYEILVNNRQVNPRTVKLPTGKPLPEQYRPDFLARIASLAELVRDTGQTDYAGKTWQAASLTRPARQGP